MTISRRPGTLAWLVLPVLLGSTPGVCQVDVVTALRASVYALAADSTEGRGLGTNGIGRAAQYLRDQLHLSGLDWRPSWCPPDTVQWASGRPVVNIIGGTGPDTAMIALVAHYDHLGLTTPDSTEATVPYNGAHDNASGVAAVLWAATILATGDSLTHGVLVCFFSGEEEGLLGSRGFLSSVPPGQIRVALVIDAVGHLDSTLLVIGVDGQSRLESLARGVLEQTGIRTEGVSSLTSGDHAAFLERGIPALGFSTGPHVRMNTPDDDPQTLDYGGLARISQALVALVRTTDSSCLSFDIPPPPPPPSPTVARRARLGTMPEFSYQGHGMKIAGVIPASPAAHAGLMTDDLLLRIDGEAVDGASGLAGVLRMHEPGDTLRVEFSRAGVLHVVSVALDSR